MSGVRDHLSRCLFGIALLLFCSGLLAANSGPAAAERANIAVAANFATALEQLIRDYTGEEGHDLQMSVASTGVLYAQIKNGAPFDILLAADAKRPRLLAEEGVAIAESRRTYAKGRLVLWGKGLPSGAEPCRNALEQGNYNKLAIANPVTAPYGLAAIQVLTRLDMLDAVQPKLVQGNNIAQTHQFVGSGNADLGFVALAQLRDPNVKYGGCQWVVPPDLHEPVEQQLVLLRRAQGNAAAVGFLAYLQTEQARQIIEAFGYDTD